jgi:GNAT superfamily N-acetyltransferase
VAISHRDATEDDLKFVVSSWSRAYKSSPAAGIIATEDWPIIMHATLKKLVARPGTRTVLAYESSDPWFLYGFICGDVTNRVPVVHFCYVKEAHRKTGIGRRLLSALGVSPYEAFNYSCWTHVILKIQHRIPYARHAPEWARYPDKDFHGNDEDRTV